MTVSLPVKWLRKVGVEKGDELDVRENENNLVISLEEAKAKTSVSLNITSLDQSSIKTIVTNAYRLGYDEINLQFDNKQALKTIADLVEKSLLGFEIIKKDEGSCVIESVTEPAKEQYENIFSKIFLNVEELFDLVSQKLEGGKVDFEDTDRKIQQYDNFCRRIIAKRGVYERNVLQWSFHSSLIHGSRELYRLLHYLDTHKVKQAKAVAEMVAGVRHLFLVMKEAHYKEDVALLETVHGLEKELTYKKGYQALKKSSESIALFHVMTALKHFYLSSSPLMGILISDSSSGESD